MQICFCLFCFAVFFPLSPSFYLFFAFPSFFQITAGSLLFASGFFLFCFSLSFFRLFCFAGLPFLSPSFYLFSLFPLFPFLLFFFAFSFLFPNYCRFFILCFRLLSLLFLLSSFSFFLSFLAFSSLFPLFSLFCFSLPFFFFCLRFTPFDL